MLGMVLGNRRQPFFFAACRRVLWSGARHEKKHAPFFTFRAHGTMLGMACRLARAPGENQVFDALLLFLLTTRRCFRLDAHRFMVVLSNDGRDDVATDALERVP